MCFIKKYKIKALGLENYKNYRTYNLSFSKLLYRTHFIKISSKNNPRNIVIYIEKNKGNVTYDFEINGNSERQEIIDKVTLQVPPNSVGKLKVKFNGFSGTTGIFIQKKK